MPPSGNQKALASGFVFPLKNKPRAKAPVPPTWERRQKRFAISFRGLGFVEGSLTEFGPVVSRANPVKGTFPEGQAELFGADG